jgi:hypothetical protein
MDEPAILADLRAPDETTLHFWRGGLAGALMAPADSFHYLQESISGAELVDAVPEEIRNNFERVRKTFLMGLLEYGLFTVADDTARLLQQPYVDFDVEDRHLVFALPLRKDRISGWRWFLGAWGVGTYRQNDTVDVRYEVEGQPHVAHGLEISLITENTFPDH